MSEGKGCEKCRITDCEYCDRFDKPKPPVAGEVGKEEVKQRNAIHVHGFALGAEAERERIMEIIDLMFARGYDEEALKELLREINITEKKEGV